MGTDTKMNWDLSSYFPTFDGAEMKEFKSSLKKDLGENLEKARTLSPLNRKNMSAWEGLFLASEDLMARLSHLSSYLGCLAAVDARNEDYQREQAAMAHTWAEFAKLQVQLLEAIKHVGDKVFSTFVARKRLKNARYFIERMREESHRTMTPDKEILAADLSVDGMDAWGRLYDTVSGKLEFDMEYPDGRQERLSMSQRRSLLEDPDRRVRRAAFKGGNEAWQSMEDVAAAALNAISGSRLTLNKHRGVSHFLDIALFQSAISKETLDAMFKAIYDNIEIPLRILRLKARTLNLESLPWYDLSAPLPVKDQQRFSWEQGSGFVDTAFSRAYPTLGTFFESMFKKKWIEWEPRTGKRPGGFCTSSLLIGESRIFMTYQGGLGDILTLAHESGHAFHSYTMRDLRPFAHNYPMTLAETASTFGEMILIDGLLHDTSISEEQKALLLDTQLGHAAIYLMDIPVRYEFEKCLYEERAEGELSVSRFKELMVSTQRQVFGDLLEQGGEDSLFWASKLHFYITEVTFYNFPYTFGYLLSRGLYAMFLAEGKNFLPRYEEFLKLTGSDTADGVALKTIGRDLRTTEFWTEAIKSLEEPLSRLEQILPTIELHKD